MAFGWRRPDGEVYAVIGDGTYLMGASELVTAVQERLKITVIVFENHGYQSIHALQRARTGQSFGLEFRQRSEGLLEGSYLDVDLAANAESFGALALRAASPEEMAAALERCREHEGPSVLVVSVEPHRLMLDSECWWDVGVPRATSSPATEAAVTESDRGRQTQRYFG